MGKVKVGVVGAGLAGLAFCKALIDDDRFDVEVFEGHGELGTRGGGITLKEGIDVFRELGLEKELSETGMIKWKTLTFRTVDKVIFEVDFEEKKLKPSATCARPELQRVLYNSLPKEKIHFGKKVVKVTEDNDGSTLEFKDGSKKTFDLVVGADGIHSKVLTTCVSNPESAATQYVDLQMFGASQEIPNPTEEDKAEFGKSTKFVYFEDDKGNGYRIFSRVMCENGVYSRDIGLCYRHPEPCSFEWDATGVTEDLLSLLEACKGYEDYEMYVGIVKNCIPGKMFKWGIYDREKPLDCWSSPKKRAVLIGDAAHPMSPFLGQGANQAFLDSLTLAKELKAHHDNFPRVFASFEGKRKPRVTNIVETSHFIGLIHTSSGEAAKVRDEILYKTLACQAIREEFSVFNPVNWVARLYEHSLKNRFYKAEKEQEKLRKQKAGAAAQNSDVVASADVDVVETQ